MILTVVFTDHAEKAKNRGPARDSRSNPSVAVASRTRHASAPDCAGGISQNKPYVADTSRTRHASVPGRSDQTSTPATDRRTRKESTEAALNSKDS